MDDNNRYSTYFSSRNIDPEGYQAVALPLYLKQTLPQDVDISILDIGCGFGQIMRALKNAGYHNVKGIDLCEQSVQWCQDNGLNVALMEVLAYKPDKKFDVIIMSHVLEHMDKTTVIPVLQHVKNNLLANDGCLYILVPNAQSNTDCYWAYEDFTHNLLFTAGSLIFVLKEAGFSDILFLDQQGLDGVYGWRKIGKKFLLKLYVMNKLFWNRVTGSSYHLPSPAIFTWELKVAARNHSDKKVQ